jgi:hypothetical protein
VDDNGEERTGMSGSVNEQFVNEEIIRKCNINAQTSYVDVGAGFGNTVFQVILSLGCSVISVAFYFFFGYFPLLILCLIGWSTFYM